MENKCVALVESLTTDASLQLCNTMSSQTRELTPADQERLKLQDVRGVLPDFQRNKLEQQAAVNWDKFYKRNETRFFKDRHWTTREFQELLGMLDSQGEEPSRVQRSLLEIGCGVGNLFYPLLEAGLNLRVFACDFSSRAIAFVKEHPCFDAEKVTAFVADLTKLACLSGNVPQSGVDLITCIFVLSAISPDLHSVVASNVAAVCRPGSILLFRDYALNDMAMVRFRPGAKIAERFYVRQDGTMAYYFSREEIVSLFCSVGFTCMEQHYVHRRTTNVKEKIDAERVFLQGKFIFKPL